jgi:hypothetical protein
MGGLEDRGKGERPRFEPAARVERHIHQQLKMGRGVARKHATPQKFILPGFF